MATDQQLLTVTEAQRAHLDLVTRLIPGYDAWATAGDCHFDYDLAQRACDFFPECLVHVKGEWAGRPIILEPWQHGIIANLFGWIRPDGTRRYRTALIYVPRKNAKTTLAAGLALYLMFCDDEPGAEIYGAAANRDQAAICHTIAKGMVLGNAALAKRGKVFGKSITYEQMGSFYQILTSKAATKHGFSPHGNIIDELHAHKNGDLAETLTSAVGSRRQPLTLYLTTADYAKPGICNDTHKYASDVRDRVIEDPEFLPVIYEAKREDDWRDEAVWRKANPNLGVSVKLDYFRSQCLKAQNTPSYENTFKRLHLNIITEQADRWLQLVHWDACKGDLTVPQLEEQLAGADCFGGLDLASITDLAALALVFPPTALREHWVGLVYPFAPRMNAIARQQTDRVPYLTWASQGFLELTEGNVIDYDVIRQRVVEKRKKFNIREIAFDSWGSAQLVNQLIDDGLEMVTFGQGFKSLSAPTKELEKLALSKAWIHGGNPLLRWCASNVAVLRDPAGNMKPSKLHSTEKIDPIVATIMALGRALARTPGGSVYATQGVIHL